MVLGAGVAVLLRVIFTGIVATVMALPYLKLVGGLALIFIAAKLLIPDNGDEDDVQAAAHLWAAVQVVAVADIVMSLDNVIAVAAAANGSLLLLIIGLAISVPLIVAGAAVIMTLLNRLPILVWAGAALLGWIAGDVIATDPAVAPLLHDFVNGQSVLADLQQFFARAQIDQDVAELIFSTLGVVVVLALGSYLRSRKLARDHSAPPAETA
jgi:YjbE family integral membrane protein